MSQWIDHCGGNCQCVSWQFCVSSARARILSRKRLKWRVVKSTIGQESRFRIGKRASGNEFAEESLEHSSAHNSISRTVSPSWKSSQHAGDDQQAEHVCAFRTWPADNRISLMTGHGHGDPDVGVVQDAGQYLRKVQFMPGF